MFDANYSIWSCLVDVLKVSTQHASWIKRTRSGKPLCDCFATRQLDSSFTTEKKNVPPQAWEIIFSFQAKSRNCTAKLSVPKSLTGVR